ncbi:DUF1206 domain-containing protein [Streptomyces sp. NPDC060006]|uniref:DUF1206 domain-containing protein n=1 Tax=Streptomyces sp. NPDC060006 TaxID=3347035 RepID=UPI0036CF461B
MTTSRVHGRIRAARHRRGTRRPDGQAVLAAAAGQRHHEPPFEARPLPSWAWSQARVEEWYSLRPGSPSLWQPPLRPGRGHDVGARLRSFTRTPVGPWFLVAVAIGLVLFGVFCLASARWHRLRLGDPGQICRLHPQARS